MRGAARATFGRHVAAELSAANWQQLWVPPGFLHGFVTLEPDTEVVYKTTGYYDKASERAVIWNDPDLAMPWPVPAAERAVGQGRGAAGLGRHAEPGSA